MPTFAANVAILDWHLVDSGNHLDWSGSTGYQTQFNAAVNIWNNYKSGVIRKDSWNTINDVTISDYYEVSSTAGVTLSVTSSSTVSSVVSVVTLANSSKLFSLMG